MEFLEEADELYTLQEIDTALDVMALSICEEYRHKNPLVIGVMNGAVVTLGHLLPKFSFLLEVDYCHATRYGKSTSGGEIDWLAYPNKPLKNRHSDQKAESSG